MAVKPNPSFALQSEPMRSPCFVRRERFAGQRTLHGGLEMQARRAPERVAVSHGGQSLDYAALNRRANQLARRLRQLGVGPETIVAIALPRGIELIVAMAAVLKAGGAYLPIEPDAPADRRQYMLADAGVKLYIVDAIADEAGDGGNGAPALVLDRERHSLAELAENDLDLEIDPAQLAYVIYTSGSTGRPKGVMIPHRNAVRLFEATQPLFGFEETDVWTLFHSPAFDFSVWEIWGALLFGGRLTVVDPATARSPEAFFELLRTERVTVLNQTPAAFEQLARYDAALGGGELDLRWTIFGGEALDCRKLAQWMGQRGLERPRMVNMYGITETTVHATFRPLVREDAKRGGESRIGLPLADLAMYVVDDALQPAAAGVAGEMLVGGDGLARGYLGRAELTAARFLPDPFGGEPGARLYRSGDAGRAVDGELAYAGRLDRQVKIRGYRIELGEIEHALADHPAVAAATALDFESSPGRRALAAILIASKEKPPAAALRGWLRERLPDYMMPARLLWVDRFPLTANGKLDRMALARLCRERSGSPQEPGTTVAPSPKRRSSKGDALRSLTELWRDTLGVASVKPDDRFFDLGGDSLAAVELVYRVREAFGVSLPFSLPFEAPTASEMAARIETAEPLEQQASALRPDPRARFEPFPLNEIQQAYYLGRLGAFDLGNVACRLFLAFESHGPDLARLEAAFNKVIERHDMLRVVVREDGLQQVLAQVPLYRIAAVDLSGLDEGRDACAAALCDAVSHETTPPHRWPLFRVCALRLAPGRYRLLLSFDLLILDGLSLLILFREWRAWSQQPDWRPRPPAVSFRDVVMAEAAQRAAPEYRRARAYWRERLPSLPKPPALPLAVAPGKVQAPRFARLADTIAAPAWARLKERAREAGLTPSALLCAAYADALAAWSQQPRFLLNLTLFNRRPLHPDVNLVIGDFTTLTLLEVDARAASDFRTRARALQERLWRDLDRREYSGARVMRDLSESRRLGSMARAPVVFTSLLQDFSEWDWLGELRYSISQTPQVWLDHVAMERGGALSFHWDYVAALFPDGLMEDMFAAYCGWLRRLIDDDAAWREPSPPLTPSAHLRLQQRINDTAAPLPSGLLHQGFERSADRFPERPALLTLGERLSYRAVEAIANRLAWALRRRGLSAGEPAAILMDKGWEQAAAALAILKAGGAYVPIDAGLPSQRVVRLLRDTRFALTQPWVDARFELPKRVETIHVFKQCLPEWPATRPEPVQRPGDLAYVMYTSGSTGEPKGVMLDHAGPVNTIVDVNQRFETTADDRVLALSAFNFDLSVYDLFGLFAAGGAVVVPDHDLARDPSHWLELMETYRVTLWNSVPALMQMLTTHAADSGRTLPARLRLVLLSGDWLPLDLPDAIRALNPKACVVSLGGATEASIWSILFPVSTVAPGWRSVPYGKPMVNQRFHVLDDLLAPRPVWVPGELFIGGVGLAKGYRNEPERTAAAFFEHPQTGERLYRTGDLGRWLPGGDIEFLGRQDSQVKIRGYRIELGEIETHLRAHPRVAGAVAAVWGDSSQDWKLAAYIVPREREEPRGGVSPEDARLLAFKLKQPGLRNDLEDAPWTELPIQTDPEQERALFLRRRSFRNFLQKPLAFERAAGLLAAARQLILEDAPLPKRRYGSAGGLYPVQLYVYFQPGRVAGAPEGLHYLDPQTAGLRWLDPGDAVADAFEEGDRRMLQKAAFALFLVAKMEAIEPIYHDDAERYCLLEAGALCQLLEREAPEHGLGLCQIGGLRFEKAREGFRLPADARYLHCLIGGAIDPAWLDQAHDDGVSADADEPRGLIEALREDLRRNLPDYMVPASFNLIEALPLTANGKLDRGALPPPDPGQGDSRLAFVTPATPLQETIADVFAGVLGSPRVSADANFFDIGGNSLRLIQAHGKLQAALGRAISVIDMFRRPTVKALAERLGEKPHEDYVNKSVERANTRRRMMEARRQKGRKMRQKS